MANVNVGTENSTAIELYYEDHGVGKPVVLIHGYPLSGASWEKQVTPLLKSGHRVITYDRRGFGHSSWPTVGYDYDTFAADLNALMEKLDLRDATLVGFSMGGGEVARYLGKYGSDRVSHAVFISAIPPYLLQAGDNPEGVPGEVFRGLEQKVLEDRPSFLSAFFENFYNVDVLKPEGRITDEAVRMSWNVAIEASPTATFACIASWSTDFRADLAKISVPTLVIHGDADRTVPLTASGARTAELVRGAELVTIPNGPHAINWTHADEVNSALLRFLG